MSGIGSFSTHRPGEAVHIKWIRCCCVSSTTAQHSSHSPLIRTPTGGETGGRRGKQKGVWDWPSVKDALTFLNTESCAALVLRCACVLPAPQLNSYNPNPAHYRAHTEERGVHCSVMYWYHPTMHHCSVQISVGREYPQCTPMSVGNRK